jgi:hypothetical protein
MKSNCQLSAYRDRLLNSLRERADRQRQEEPGSLRVFVNHAAVGVAECGFTPTTWVLVSLQDPIREIELRTEAGLLVGSLCASTVSPKAARFTAGHYSIDVCVENGLCGGTLRIMSRAGVPLWRRLQAQGWTAALRSQALGSRALARLHRLGQDPARMLRAGWPWVGTVARVMIAGAVLLLVVDRLTNQPDHRTPGTVDPAIHFLKDQQLEVSHLRRSVTQLQDAHKTRGELEARLLVRLTKAVEDRQPLREDIHRLTVVLDAMNKEHAALTARVEAASTEREHLIEEVQRLIAANATLSRDVAVLETRAQVASARLDTAAHPFKFWVSFQDGTSDKSIEALIEEIKGRKGPVDSGWYSVEVTLPQTHTPNSFVETLKKAPIVKAVRTSLGSTPAQ